jgi:hypothetical protein
MACKGLERKHRNESHQHQSNRKKSFAGFHGEQTFLFLIVPKGTVLIIARPPLKSNYFQQNIP